MINKKFVIMGLIALLVIGIVKFGHSKCPDCQDIQSGKKK